MGLSTFIILCNHHLCLVPKCCHHPLKTFKKGSHVGFWMSQEWTRDHSSSLPGVSSVQFSCSVVSDSLWPHGLQHARPPCPSSTPGVYSNSCPLSWWCHPTIASSVIPFSSHLQSFFNLSQHQGLFKWVSSLHQVAKVLAFQLQPQSFQWIFRTDFQGSLQCNNLYLRGRVFQL